MQQSNALSNVHEGTTAGERTVLTIRGVEYPFRWCPAGTFLMGIRRNNETQHQVKLTKGFWMLETSVTQEVWQSVMGHNPSHFQDDIKSGTLLHPVENVSWYDCQDFIEKLNSLAWSSTNPRFKFALPTEAQWEYACRAGTTGPYGGTGKLDDMGWYDSNGSNRPHETHKVGTKLANAWGLFDMHGKMYGSGAEIGMVTI